MDTYWSDHFITDSIDIVHGFRNRYQTGKDLKLYILNLEDLKHSWLVDLESCEDIVDTHWTDEMLGKMIKSPYVPKDTVKEFPKRLPFKFQNKSADTYFTSPSLGIAGKKINLPNVIFSQEYTKMPATDDHLF